MALAIYDRFFVFGDGALLGEATSVEVTFEGDSEPVQTMVKDLAGCTPKPKMAMIAVDNFVPSSGFEYDAIKKWKGNEFVTFRVQSGGSGKKFEADGFIVGPALSSGIGATSLKFSVRCQASIFE